VKLTANYQSISQMAKSMAYGPADRVFQHAREAAKERFPVSLDEHDDGWAVYGEGEAALVAEYGDRPWITPEHWGVRSVMGAIDGRA
jgi:hypothetical protein